MGPLALCPIEAKELNHNGNQITSLDLGRQSTLSYTSAVPTKVGIDTPRKCALFLALMKLMGKPANSHRKQSSKRFDKENGLLRPLPDPDNFSKGYPREFTNYEVKIVATPRR